MLAQKDEYIRDASDTIYRLSQEEKIRQQCEAREDYYRRQRGMQKRLERMEETIEKQGETMKQQADVIKQQKTLLEEKERETENLRFQLSQYRKQGGEERL